MNNQNEQKNPLDSMCEQIEKSPNYQPHTSDETFLYSLISQVKIKQENAFIIQPCSFLYIPSYTVYQIKRLRLNDISYVNNFSNYFWIEEEKSWYVDDSLILLVDKNGNASIHRKQSIQENNFNSPVNFPTVDDILNQAPWDPARVSKAPDKG